MPQKLAVLRVGSSGVVSASVGSLSPLPDWGQSFSSLLGRTPSAGKWAQGLFLRARMDWVYAM